MARVRRSRYVCFFYDDFPFLDVGLLLRGSVEPVTVRQGYALSILRGEAIPLSADELDLAASTPSDDWVEAVDEEATRELARKGVLLSDENDPELETLRARHESLQSMGWNLEAALYYFLSKWRGIDLRLLAGQDEASDLLPPTDEAVRAFVDQFGPPPPAFSSAASPLAVHELPLVERKGGLYDVLLRRRTTRSFDRSAPLAQWELAVVLRYVFGYLGYVPLLGRVTTLKRTSPSAGGFHPIEAYPLIMAVDGLDPGLYHYDAAEHALELLAPFGVDEARAAATAFVCGQTYFGDAHVLLVLAARFERAFWKYRNHRKALTALVMDAAHLSQTLYLVATELGLGAFVTAAINNADIEEWLGLDGYREGVLAVCGFGRPAAEPSPFDPEFLPFVPRETGPRSP
ncbi:MAG TPA: putative peptide maturation dehydrogenase [Gaiellaceae bacterium]|jgi:putative peptide maturation dehydrogenase